MIIRARTEDDLDALVEIGAAVQSHDGYPGPGTDLRAFLVSRDALGTWVATNDGAVAGHVALHRSSLPVVMELASKTVGCPVDKLAVVARLLVARTARRLGIGRALLEHAAADARARGLHPILDVVTGYAAAITLYESCGWRNVGEVRMRFPDGFSLQSYVYVAP